jgi:hypothetical protein
MQMKLQGWHLQRNNLTSSSYQQEIQVFSTDQDPPRPQLPINLPTILLPLVRMETPISITLRWQSSLILCPVTSAHIRRWDPKWMQPPHVRVLKDLAGHRIVAHLLGFVCESYKLQILHNISLEAEFQHAGSSFLQHQNGEALEHMSAKLFFE